MKKFLIKTKRVFYKKNIKGSMDDSITYFNKSMQDKDKAELVRIQGHAKRLIRSSNEKATNI